MQKKLLQSFFSLHSWRQRTGATFRLRRIRPADPCTSSRRRSSSVSARKTAARNRPSTTTRRRTRRGAASSRRRTARTTGRRCPYSRCIPTGRTTYRWRSAGTSSRRCWTTGWRTAGRPPSSCTPYRFRSTSKRTPTSYERRPRSPPNAAATTRWAPISFEVTLRLDDRDPRVNAIIIINNNN